MRIKEGVEVPGFSVMAGLSPGAAVETKQRANGGWAPAVHSVEGGSVFPVSHWWDTEALVPGIVVVWTCPLVKLRFCSSHGKYPPEPSHPSGPSRQPVSQGGPWLCLS